MIKKLAAVITGIAMLFTSAAYAETPESEENSANTIQIVVDGEKLIPKDVNGKIVHPFLSDGTTYLPVRAVSEALGQKVEWDGVNMVIFVGERSEAVFEKSDVIKIVVNGNLIEPKDVNGKIVNPFLIDGTTYVPVRAITQALGKEINWDGETKTVYIFSDTFEVDLSTLKPFYDKTMMSVSSLPVSGSMFNLLLSKFTTNDFLKEFCDNFTPTGTLQTLTISSVPAAQALTSDIANTLIQVYALCDYAEKNSYTKNESFKKAFEEIFPYVEKELAEEYDIEKAVELGITSKEEYQNFVKSFVTYILTSQTIQEKAAAKDYDLSEYEKLYRTNYITAKHILVEDEALAKEIISKIEKGESFDSLMLEHNIDPGATAEGYTFTYGEMVEPFEKAAFALKENEFTKTPVKSDFGYHIIMRLPVSEQILKEAKTAWNGQFAQAAAQNEINTIIENAKVEYTADYENYIKTIK